MKKAAFVALGFMFCVAVPAMTQSHINGKTEDMQTGVRAVRQGNTIINNDSAAPGQLVMLQKLG